MGVRSFRTIRPPALLWSSPPSNVNRSALERRPQVNGTRIPAQFARTLDKFSSHPAQQAVVIDDCGEVCDRTGDAPRACVGQRPYRIQRPQNALFRRSSSFERTHSGAATRNQIGTASRVAQNESIAVSVRPDIPGTYDHGYRRPPPAVGDFLKSLSPRLFARDARVSAVSPSTLDAPGTRSNPSRISGYDQPPCPLSGCRIIDQHYDWVPQERRAHDRPRCFSC